MDNKLGQTVTPIRRSTRNRLLHRQATLILPTTGERVKRDFTLRDPAIYGTAANNGVQSSNEQTPLLPKISTAATPQSRSQRFVQCAKESAIQFYAFWTTATGHNVLKCSLAYLVATLATFSVPFAAMLGTHQDGNQLVANIVVWFDPARSAGSMEQGILLAFLAFLYGAFIAFGSQTVSFIFTSQDLDVVGHVVVLLVFCWGGLGFLAWFKQYTGHPLVNTACSVASLAIVTCITKEGVVQTGDFSYYKVMQVLKMLVVGIIISSIVNLMIWPVSARTNLRESLIKTTDAFGELLTTLSVSFLSGREEDLKHPAVAAASDRFKLVFSSLPNLLAEAKYEHHFLGTEKQYHIEMRLVECVQHLAQDMGGLRSAASTQISLLSESASFSDALSPVQSPVSNSSLFGDGHIKSIPSNGAAQYQSMDAELGSEQSSLGHIENQSAQTIANGSLQRKFSVQSPGTIFDTFIEHLGPPMRSMAWTMKEVLKALPYAPAPDRDHGNLPKFRSSLNDAIKLFNKSRKESLGMVYKSKELSQTHALHVAADFEEVAASCGHFASSLEDFAETCLQHLDILDELELEIQERPNGRSWRWLLFWTRRGGSTALANPSHEESAISTNITTWKTEYPQSSLGFPYFFYPYLRVFRREDVKFAIKVGGGATFFAMFAFIPATEPYFNHWHLEWSLVSYMLICSMNIGASNTTAWSRSYGTLFGALIAIVVWLLCNENGYALAISGWLVSLVCFYFIVAQNQGPMGRFILLTYNLTILYSYALTIDDPDTNKGDDEAELNPKIFEIAFHRFTAVFIGVIGGMFVTYYIWPVSARQKVKTGLSMLWLRMGLIWKRAPLQTLVDVNRPVLPVYMDIRVETKLREYLDVLDSLRLSAESEFKLRGPFQTESFDILIKSTSRMLDSFHALNVVITKDLKATSGQIEILKYTAVERDQLALRICHLLSVLASSLNMEYPLNDALPSTTHVRDRLLGKLFEFRQGDTKNSMACDDDYEPLYCYILVTASIAAELEICGKELEKLYSTLGEKVLTLA